jgi:CubicO group peptidase (beta-lactamase class C family)
MFAEGWAVYTEDMMADAGYLDNDPLFRLVQLKFYLRTMANAILDQGVHVDNWSKEQAMDLMVNQTFQQEREADGKWKRAQLTSTQLATYFVGAQEHFDMRKAVEAKQGASFNAEGLPRPGAVLWRAAGALRAPADAGRTDQLKQARHAATSHDIPSEPTMRRPTLLIALLFATAQAPAAEPSRTDVAAFAARTLDANCDKAAPGMAVLLARGDEVLYRGACGSANLELGVPLSADHVFRIGSVTKQFAAAAALKLVEAGKLSLDDPLTKFVPGYPGGERVTVRMLLNHTSGLRSYTDVPGVMTGTPIMRDVTTAELIDTFKAEKPDFAPGEGWHYNNSGYVLLGAVIEAASGKPWHVYLDETFFKPLGMRHTRYGNQQERVIPGHVDGYTFNEDHWARAGYLSMTQPHAAGALVSTVDDLLTWNRALHEGKVLQDASYRAMITPVGKAVENNYGFGISTGTLRGGAAAAARRWHPRLQRLSPVPARQRYQRGGALQRGWGAPGGEGPQHDRQPACGAGDRQPVSGEEGDRARCRHAEAVRRRVSGRQGRGAGRAGGRRQADLAAQRWIGVRADPGRHGYLPVQGKPVAHHLRARRGGRDQGDALLPGG